MSFTGQQLRDRYARDTGSIELAADLAYDRDDHAWFYAQSTSDLMTLWALCCDINTMPAYDDEVYDALAERGHFEPCKGCGSTSHGPLGGTLKCVDCVGVDIHNYTALHDRRYKTRQYPNRTRKVS